MSVSTSFLPPLLIQAGDHDLTVSPGRIFEELQGDPADFSIPAGGLPVQIACPAGAGAGYYAWSTFYDPSRPPLVSPTRWHPDTLQDEMERIFLFKQYGQWSEDREIWVRHDLTQAELLVEEELCVAK
jgi:hypothetical protein